MPTPRPQNQQRHEGAYLLRLAVEATPPSTSERL